MHTIMHMLVIAHLRLCKMHMLVILTLFDFCLVFALRSLPHIFTVI